MERSRDGRVHSVVLCDRWPCDDDGVSSRSRSVHPVLGGDGRPVYHVVLIGTIEARAGGRLAGGRDSPPSTGRSLSYGCQGSDEALIEGQRMSYGTAGELEERKIRGSFRCGKRMTPRHTSHIPSGDDVIF